VKEKGSKDQNSTEQREHRAVLHIYLATEAAIINFFDNGSIA
jgi:hypothetical protein